MKKKILIVDCNLKIGGIQKALVSLLNELHDVYEVDLLLLYKHGPLLNEIPEDIHVIETKSAMRYMGMAQADCKTFREKLIRGFYAFLTKAFGQEVAVRLVAPTLRRDRFVQKTHYDLAISYSHIANSKLFYGGTAEYVIRAVAAEKKACYLHCDYKSSNNASQYSNRLYSRFDHIVCVSESTRRHLIEVVPEIREKTCTIYNPIDTEKVRYLAGQSPVEYDSNYLNLLTVARLTSEKGVARFVHALGVVANEKIRYYVVGSGGEREKIEQEIERYSLQNRVFLVGEQNNPYRYMINADALVVPSYHEAAPVVFQEARALALPILTTRTTSAEEMVGTEYGIVVENTDEALISFLREKWKVLKEWESGMSVDNGINWRMGYEEMLQN